jgi:hypothetical protein
MFYFINGCSYEHFINILNDQYIYANKYIEKKYTRMMDLTDYIYTNIIFDEINIRDNEKWPMGEIGIIIHPKILKHKNCIINVGWNGYIDDKSIVIKKTSSLKKISKKINMIKNKILNSYNKSSTIYILSNEVLFKKKISLQKYMVGIVIYDEKNKELKSKVSKLLKEYDYNIPIFNEFPKSKEIM